MRLWWVAVVVLVVLAEVHGKGRGGGGSRGSRGSRGSSSGRSSSSSSRRSLTGKLAKGAAIGAGAYIAYKGVKAVGKFAKYAALSSTSWRLNDWDSWRQQDGMMCRTTADCSWLDPGLMCQNREISWTISPNWFGGDYRSVIGQCQCVNAGIWDNNNLNCRADNFWTGVLGVLTILFMLAFGCCCCVGVAWFFFRR